MSIGSREIGGRTSGPNAGFLTIRPKGAGNRGVGVFLKGPEGGDQTGYSFFHDGAEDLDEVPVFYNGTAPLTPQASGALSSVASVSESARKDRFEETVRTENVSVRLRSGVIAEVGPGRAATVGSEGARPPETCAPNDSLACAPAPAPELRP